MNASAISALAALAGTAVGGLTSVVANWLTHRIQIRAQWLQHEKNRRQILYRDFIEEASKCYIDALQHGEADIAGLVGLYAKRGRHRENDPGFLSGAGQDLRRATRNGDSWND
jgi:hypothetical protein